MGDVRLCPECGGVVTPSWRERRFKTFCSDTCADRAYRRRTADKKREQRQAWRDANRERVREVDRLWRRANAEAVNTNARRRYAAADPEWRLRASRKWQQANPEKFRESLRQWKLRNPNHASEQAKRWRVANPERVRESTRRRRAIKLSARVEVYRELDIYERDQWLCQLCGGPVDGSVKYPDPMSASIDHVRPLSRGGTDEPGNVQLAHLTCNLRKYANVPGDNSRPKRQAASRR